MAKEYYEKGVKGEYNVEFRVIHPNGDIRWVHEEAYPIHENDQVVRIAGYSVDITAKKEALIAMTNNELKFKTLFEGANDSIYIIKASNKMILELNDKAAESLGFKKEDLIGKTTGTFDVPFEPVKRQWISDQIAENGIVKFEHGHIRKDGSIMPVEIISKKITFEGQEVYQAHARDVSDRKNAEVEIQRSFKEISFSQNLTEAADKGATISYIRNLIFEGVSELINSMNNRLYSYDPESNELILEKADIIEYF